MLKLYPNVIDPSNTLAREAEGGFSSFTERHLQILWLEQKLLKNLMTSQREIIEVISPGIWNKDGGPDFLKAHLRIGDRVYRGDVEIHLFENGWHSHGHHCNPRYNQVILHVCYKPSLQSLSINKENGQQAHSCYLEKSLALPLEQLKASIDLDIYPHEIFSTKGRCAELLFQTLSDLQIRSVFQSAAYWRLEKKLNHLQLASSTQPMQFASGVAMALGYRHNAKAFLDLFLYLLNFRDLPYQELLAVALGSCGFLEEGRKDSWESSPYYQYIRSLWWGKKDQVTHQACLKLDRIRPLHHPIRRLAFLAHFLQDRHLEEIWSRALNLWQMAASTSKMSSKKLENQLLNIFPVYQDEYWDCHYTFESDNEKTCPLGIGKDIKLHILLNTTLPLLYGIIKESGSICEWEKFQQFYTSLAISGNSKSFYLHQRFFGGKQNEEFFEEAQIMQGAYQLHQDFCTHYEASCKGCPFVERYQRSCFNA